MPRPAQRQRVLPPLPISRAVSERRLLHHPQLHAWCRLCVSSITETLSTLYVYQMTAFTDFTPVRNLSSTKSCARIEEGKVYTTYGSTFCCADGCCEHLEAPKYSTRIPNLPNPCTSFIVLTAFCIPAMKIMRSGSLTTGRSCVAASTQQPASQSRALLNSQAPTLNCANRHASHFGYHRAAFLRSWRRRAGPFGHLRGHLVWTQG